MEGIHPLIKSIVPNPVYSETFTELAVPDPTVTFQQLVHDFRERGARAIIIHSIVCSISPTAVGTDVCTVTDNYNRTVLQFYIDKSFSGFLNFSHVIIASEINLKFVGVGIGANIALFTVQYQYVYDTESKVLKL
jgi:small-conductance mechanosensitive channel